jgi:plastocyanin
LATLALFAGACGDDDDSTAQPGAVEPKAASEFTVTGADYSYEAPAEVSGGVVTMEFENTGKFVHEAAVLGIGDTPLEQAVKDFGVAVQGGPIAAYITAAGGVGNVKPGESQTATFALPAGNYLFVCALTDADSNEGGGPPAEGLPVHADQGMAKIVTVSGDNGRSLPAADGTVTARDYGFDLPALTAGAKNLVFKNEGQQFHHVVMMEFPEGVDEAGAAKIFDEMANMGPDSPPPSGPMPEDIATSVVFSPGLGGTFDATFTSGRTYAAVCFLSDKTGGPPHAFAHQMVKYFRIA